MNIGPDDDVGGESEVADLDAGGRERLGAPPVRRPVVLITGAARRLGCAMALHLAQQGWDVGVHCHTSVDEAHATAQAVRALGGRAQVLPADLSDEAACNALVPQAVAALGRLDAVVNNASQFVYDTIDTVTHVSLDAHWRANTAPALLLSRALHQHLQARQAQGCVVNLLDQKLWNPNPDYLSYTLSKVALEAATTLLAQALAPVLRVVGVAPGPTLVSYLMDDAKLSDVQRNLPLGRGSSVKDVVEAVAFALNNQSLTGTTLLVDAGSHLKPMGRDFPFLV